MRKAPSSLGIQALRKSYERGENTPTRVISGIYDRMQAQGSESIWISTVPREQALERTAAIERSALSNLPLFGIPFAVKDNIDVAGMPTTAGLPEPLRVATESAPVVERLIAAGAILIGKTNLDQLACGLTGVRSPYGVPQNPFDSAYIPGGSSSGSATAVSRGLVSFALGTDTAGSGRVPAAFNDLVGLKPSPGLLSTRGVVPACRSLDCISVFALSVDEAQQVAELMRGYDDDDALSQAGADRLSFYTTHSSARIRFGVPRAEQLRFFGDEAAKQAFSSAVERMIELGNQCVAIDFEPFAETAAFLYEGPWIAERATLLRELPGSTRLLPVISDIFADADKYDAVSTFRASHRLSELGRRVSRYWSDIDVLLVPTTPTIYTIEQVLAEPRSLNARLGTYTNFVNLLRSCAIAIPNGFRGDGLPTGVTLIGPESADARIIEIAKRFETSLRRETDAEAPVPASSLQAARTSPVVKGPVKLAVVGAHLSGQPLNWQLTSLGAKLVEACRTAPAYRLYALRGTNIPKPGLLRTTIDGVSIQVEVWELEASALGQFMSYVAPPLCIGTLELEDRSAVLGFLCESHALSSAEDISSFGGWRAFLEHKL